MSVRRDANLDKRGKPRLNEVQKDWPLSQQDPSLSVRQKACVYATSLHTLIQWGQTYSFRSDRIVDMLCQQVESLSQGCFRLHLILDGREPDSSGQREVTPSQAGSYERSRFSVCFGPFSYGTLVLRSKDDQEKESLELAVWAQILAECCGWILYTHEMFCLTNEEPVGCGKHNQPRLTRKQHEVLKLMCQGYSKEEVAQILGISLHTVGTHWWAIYQRLEASNPVEVKIKAYRYGLFSPVRSGTKPSL